VERVTGSDFVNDVTTDSRARHIRHYFYGTSPESVSRAAAKAAQIFGPDAVAGWHSPPFREAGALEDRGILDDILATRPDVIWVSLSTPKQEYWMANHASSFPGTILVGIGATLDFFAGAKARAPVILQRLGLEWLFRIFQEPKRLWPRYRRVIPGMLKVLIYVLVKR
jgi:N-acetylglucosaminyldiphosphoundecaprenol N-acetyl-beta-D-mannosaminyltransferase